MRRFRGWDHGLCAPAPGPFANSVVYLNGPHPKPCQSGETIWGSKAEEEGYGLFGFPGQRGSVSHVGAALERPEHRL